MTTRIDTKFAAVRTEGRPALVTFITAGDPDMETSLAVMKALPGAGADVPQGVPAADEHEAGARECQQDAAQI